MRTDSSRPPDDAAPPEAPARPSTRIDDLEAALARAREERDLQARAIQQELGELNRIYDRLRNDLATARGERDRALEAARLERERRSRETEELARRLEALSRTGVASGARPFSADGFVQQRLADAPALRVPLAEGDLPRVPGFEILALVGRGGMATVYHARSEVDGLEVAIKLLHDGAGAARARTELFLREAAVMLQLEHPGLVRALDAGECAYGRYLVLELVRGESLAARLRREGPLEERRAIAVALEAARALGYCARLGLAHRDVKPSNLLVAPDGSIKLCDFGLASLSQDEDPTRPYGSPGYAAPEQLVAPGVVDERADIYGLGCSLWHMVVGRRAFHAPAQQAFELARVHDLPDPRFEGADISPRLAQVIRRMGRRDRERRYRRWDECLLDLMLVQKGNPPFAAHLAEALEPSNRPPSDVGVEDTTIAGSTGSAAGSAHDADAEDASSSWASPPPRAGSPDESEDDLGSGPLEGPPGTASRTRTDLGTAAREAGAVAWAGPPVESAPAPEPADAPARHDPGRGPLRRRTLRVAFGVAALATAVGFLAGRRPEADPTEALERRARTLAAEGRPREAARALREAALLLPPEEAARLIRLADRLERD